MRLHYVLVILLLASPVLADLSDPAMSGIVLLIGAIAVIGTFFAGDQGIKKYKESKKKDSNNGDGDERNDEKNEQEDEEKEEKVKDLEKLSKLLKKKLKENIIPNWIEFLQFIDEDIKVDKDDEEQQKKLQDLFKQLQKYADECVKEREKEWKKFVDEKEDDIKDIERELDKDEKEKIKEIERVRENILDNYKGFAEMILRFSGNAISSGNLDQLIKAKKDLAQDLSNLHQGDAIHKLRINQIIDEIKKKHTNTK